MAAFQTYASAKRFPVTTIWLSGLKAAVRNIVQSAIEPELRDKLAGLSIPELASRVLLKCQDPAPIRAARVALPGQLVAPPMRTGLGCDKGLPTG